MCYATLKKYLAVLIGLAVTATGLSAAPAEEQPAAAAEKEMVLDPTTGKMVTAPEYGGTLTQAAGRDQKVFDTYLAWSPFQVSSAVVEKLGIVDWGLSRDEFHFRGGYPAPLFALKGALAESWDMSPDRLIYTFNIRQGVHWHDKPPVNGRELTAKDVEHSFHRFLGNRLTGTEFSEAEPAVTAGELGTVPFESITATDEYTVVFTLKEPYLRTPNMILDWHTIVIYPPEVIKEDGDASDWRNLVGTGPFELTDYVESVSITYTKNPDYWGYDEKFPDNRLPYVDEFRVLFMAEEATRLAALRSRKIDYSGYHGAGTMIKSIDVAESLKRTNPELMLNEYSERADNGFIFNVSEPPFDDIRVRKAMNMALDHETINNTYFKGYGDTTPRGQIGMPGFHVPFDEWPQEVKDAYSYNPEGAEKLLDEAGYPRGADGIRFKTDAKFRDSEDVGWVEAVAAYWSEIGVDVRLDPRPADAAWNAWWADPEREQGLVHYAFGALSDSYDAMLRFTPAFQYNPAKSDDPVFNALFERAKTATTFEDQREPILEMDMYFKKSVWGVPGPEVPQFNVTQPWVKGYNSEGGLGGLQWYAVFARLWIDQDLKKEMGF